MCAVWLLGNCLRKELGTSGKWGQEWLRGKSHHLTPFQSFPHQISNGYIRMFSQELCWAYDRTQLKSLMRVFGALVTMWKYSCWLVCTVSILGNWDPGMEESGPGVGR